MIDRDRLKRANQTAREALLAERTPQGHWVGELSSSALSTATACSALAIADREKYRALIDVGLAWILERQNPDGGWGDTDKSLSNISTTMLVRAAIHLASRERERPEVLQRAEAYIAAKGGIPGLRKRYGKDKTFAVPILTNCALAGLVPWSEVSPLPFELACLPQSWYRFARLPVVSYAIPALVAIGQARYFHQKPWNPIARVVRAASVERSLIVLQKMQPASGGYLEATPLTSFVVMSLASIGRRDHPVTQLGLKFILDSVRADGSWPIDTNLATWVTTLAINALGTHGGTDYLTHELLVWLFNCQHRERHAFTGAEPGGWGWSNLSGAVPDADDTPGALLALATFSKALEMEISSAVRLKRPVKDKEIFESVFLDYEGPRRQTWLRLFSTGHGSLGVSWLLSLQNSNGGWPTFCRGWGKLPFDRSGTDLTAHAIRATIGQFIECPAGDGKFPPDGAPIPRGSFREKALQYLVRQQRPDGSWLPLWFGNQHRADDENPLYGTAKVLLAYRDLGRMADEPARRGVEYLLTQQNADGGFGGDGISSSNEETALVVETLLAAYERPAVQSAVERGLGWLIEAVETGRFRTPSPIGFYFAKLWYYEKLYPMIFTVGALRAAVETLDGSEPPT